MRALAFATATLAAVITAFPAVAGDVYGQPSLPDATAVWDGMLHLRVACAPGGPQCNVEMAIYDPRDTAHSITGTDAKVDAGATRTITIDPAGTESRKIAALDSIFVRMHPHLADGREPSPQPQPVEKTLSLKGPAKAKPKPLGPRTKRQVVKDKHGDSRCSFDLTRAAATRKGRTVVFQVTVAQRMGAHDGFGNPITPQLEFPYPKSQGGSGRTPIQVAGDGRLRGYTQHYWPRVPHTVGAHTVTWKIPLKYLSKRSFRWRAISNDGYKVCDAAPNKGYKTFIR